MSFATFSYFRLFSSTWMTYILEWRLYASAFWCPTDAPSKFHPKTSISTEKMPSLKVRIAFHPPFHVGDRYSSTNKQAIFGANNWTRRPTGWMKHSFINFHLSEIRTFYFWVWAPSQLHQTQQPKVEPFAHKSAQPRHSPGARAAQASQDLKRGCEFIKRPGVRWELVTFFQGEQVETQFQWRIFA